MKYGFSRCRHCDCLAQHSIMHWNEQLQVLYCTKRSLMVIPAKHGVNCKSFVPVSLWSIIKDYVKHRCFKGGQ